MDTPQPIQPTPQQTQSAPMPPRSSGLGKMLLFGSIILIAIVSVALAVALPKTNVEDRSKAATAGACIAQATVAASTCNGKCGADQDCLSGMICYKTSGATEGVCRNPSVPTSTTCTGPTATPVAACTKTCTFNYDCNLTAGEQCVGTNANNTLSVTGTTPRAATAAELATLASDQIINVLPGGQYHADATGKMTLSIVSKKAGTFTVHVFDIVAVKGKLDPQKLLTTKTFSFGANQVVTVTVVLPRCGRYQVDYASALVAGTPYDKNVVNHYFWGTVFEIPCQSGCCQVPTVAAASSVATPIDLQKLQLSNPTTLTAITGYSTLTGTTSVTKATMPTYTIEAVTFPDVFPTGVGSVKFEANGALIRIDNTEPYSASDAGITLPAGVYTIKASLYSLDNATGTLIKSVTTSLTVK